MITPWDDDLKPAAVDKPRRGGQRRGQQQRQHPPESKQMQQTGQQFSPFPSPQTQQYQQIQQQQLHPTQQLYPTPQNGLDYNGGQSSRATTGSGPAVSAASAASTTTNNREPSDAFTDAIERILAAVDNREEEDNNMLGTTGEDNNQSSLPGPLTTTEISKLSMLCTVQSTGRHGITDSLGFVDVDPDLLVQLVTHLAKHINLASNISIIQAVYDAIQGAKSRGQNRLNVDQVRGSHLTPNHLARSCLCHLFFLTKPYFVS
jgi:hypothetical protein